MTELQRKSLLEVAANDRFAIVDGPFGTQLHAADYVPEGVPVVRVTNTSFEGRFLSERLVFISERKAQGLRRSMVQPGDIIVAKTGATIGKSGMFPTKWLKGIIASSCIKITVDHRKADNRFIGYLIQSEDGQRKIIDGASGSTRTTINTKPFGAIEFDFPPRPEQTQIAEILSTVDRAIEQTEAVTAKQQRIKTGLMQDLLTRGIDEDGNVRSERTHEFKDSGLGRIPASWIVDTLNRCVRADAPICYGILMPGQGSDNGVPVVKVRDIVGGRILLEDLLLTDPRIDRQYSRSRLCAGDLLMTIRGTTGRIARVPPELEGANITQDTARVRLAARCSPRFFYFLLQSTAVQEQISLHTIGQAVKGINIGDVKRLRLATPLRDEQEHIADRLEGIDVALIGARRELGKLRSVKSGLMQALLSGGRRVTALLFQPEGAKA